MSLLFERGFQPHDVPVGPEEKETLFDLESFQQRKTIEAEAAPEITAAAAEEIFSRAVIDGWAFDLEALSLGRRLGFDILECAVHWDDDPSSRVNPIKDFIGVVREWRTIRSNFKRDIYGLAERPSPLSSSHGETSAQAA